MAALIAHAVRGASRNRPGRRANPSRATGPGPGAGGSAQFRAPPWVGEPGRKAVRQAVGGDAHLLEGVTVPQRHGPVLHRLAVDCDPPGCPDLVLAPVAPADRAALVVFGGDLAADLLLDLAGPFPPPGLRGPEEDRHLDRRQGGGEAGHRALAGVGLLRGL